MAHEDRQLDESREGTQRHSAGAGGGGDDDRGPRDGGRRPARDPETRRRDHDSIERLTDDVVPDLIDRLIATGLGEIEVREDDWRIRLRVPPGGARLFHERTDRGRTAGDGRGARDGRATDARQMSDGRDAATRAAAAGATPANVATGAVEAHTNGTGALAASPAGTSHRVIATSPAVGIFQPRPDVRAGTRVRAGDRLATVDLLGVPQDVVAPEDGVVVDTMAEAGEGVEYGQDLVLIEPARPRHGGDHATTTATAAMTES